MIKKNEINKIAQDLNVRTSTIDKDWVLGHFIDAIFSIPECRNCLVFKGGTHLKKCRFPNYRFSEDLDFTSTHEDFILTRELLDKMITLVTERTGLPLHIDSLETLYFENKLTGYAAHIKFWGADHRQDQAPPDPSRWTSSIKIEIILYEQMIFPAENMRVIHTYSDKLTSWADSVPCYDLKEVLAEKLRALIQRSYTAPRDYYDIWYLSRHNSYLDWDAIVIAFHKKMQFKGLSFNGVDQLLNDANDNILKKAWKNSLEHQIASGELPAYDTVKQNLQSLFERIFAEKK